MQRSKKNPQDSPGHTKENSSETPVTSHQNNNAPEEGRDEESAPAARRSVRFAATTDSITVERYIGVAESGLEGRRPPSCGGARMPSARCGGTGLTVSNSRRRI